MNLSALIKTLKDDQAVYFPWAERIVICLAVLIAYASVWPNEFVYDDRYLIVLNDFLRHWSSLPKLLTSLSYAGSGELIGFHRPVQMLIYFMLYQLFGPSTGAFHALNIALHAVNACLLHHFGIRAGLKKGAVFAAALLWAVHPLHTTDVTYMSGTADLLWACFCLLGLITLLPDFSPRKIGLSMIFFILALGSKESAVVFPALAAITLFLVSKKPTQFSTYLKTWPLWLLAACFIANCLWLIQKSDSGALDPILFRDYISRALTSLATLPTYARLIIWPTGLHMERSFHIFSTLLAWQPAAGALMAGLGLLQILWNGVRLYRSSHGGGVVGGSALSFGLLWFAVALSPVTGIVLLVDALIHEGWMYMPTMGLFLGVAQAIAARPVKNKNVKNGAWVLVLSLTFSLGTATLLQNKTWRNSETVYQTIVQNGGFVGRFQDFLGMWYMDQGEFDKAIKEFQSEIDHPEGRPNTLLADIHWRLAMAWLHISPDKGSNTFTFDPATLPACQHVPEAIAELGKVLQDNPDYYWADEVLAAIYRYQDNKQMMVFHLKKIDEVLQRQSAQ